MLKASGVWQGMVLLSWQNEVLNLTDVIGVISSSLLKDQRGAPDISFVFGGICDECVTLFLVHLEHSRLLMVICIESSSWQARCRD